MRRPLAVTALVLAVIMMGRMVWWDSAYGQTAFGQRSQQAVPARGEELTINGRVYDVQVRQGYYTPRLWIYLDSIIILKSSVSEENKETQISYQMICQTEVCERPLMGSRIQVTGQFETFSQARNPGQFHAEQYYQTLGICGILKDAVILENSRQYSYIRESLFTARAYFKEKLYQYIPEKEASILSAMLLGDKSGLDQELENLYQDSGIVHILTISGLHITLIGMGVYRLLRKIRCPTIAAVAASSMVLILYGMMTGLGISAVRAIGMYLIRMLAELTGRTYDMLTALGMMALIMLAKHPLYLQNGGFLLSFGSICGIGILLPLMSKNAHADSTQLQLDENILKWHTPGHNVFMCAIRYFKNAFCQGLAISLFTLPIQLTLFYEIPVYSVLINLAVLPFVRLIMMSAVASLLIPGGQSIAFVSVYILKGYEWLCHLLEGLPGRTWNPGQPKIWQIGVYYLFLVIYVLLHGMKKGGRGKVLLLASAVCFMGVKMPTELSITFLDVGQGDGICIRTREETYLFDCGSSSESNVGDNILIPYLKSQGIRRIDGIFVSHGDSDHTSGIVELICGGRSEGIDIRHLILPAIAKNRYTEEFVKLLEAVERSGQDIQVSYMGKGISWQSGNVEFTCLHPTKGEAVLEDNAYSQCFLVKYKRFSLLLTGDVEGEGEKQLLQTLYEQQIRDITVLKVAHHGSRNSTSMELLNQLCPTAAIISCGMDNGYGHPHKELLERLENIQCPVYQTSDTGAVKLWITSDRLHLQTYCR